MHMGVDDRFASGLFVVGSREGNSLGAEGSREQGAAEGAKGISSRQANVAHRLPLQLPEYLHSAASSRGHVSSPRQLRSGWQRDRAPGLERAFPRRLAAFQVDRSEGLLAAIPL